MNIVFQEFIKNYTYFKYNKLQPGDYVEFHPQSKKKVMLKMCGIYQNTFDHLIDDYLQKELYLENFEKKNEKLIDDIKADKHYDKKNMEKKKKYSTNKESKKKKKITLPIIIYGIYLKG